jgi:hypothetical protein
MRIGKWIIVEKMKMIPFAPEFVVERIMEMDKADKEKIAYLLVWNIYEGEKHIHRNPRSKQEIKAERLASLSRVNEAMGREAAP